MARLAVILILLLTACAAAPRGQTPPPRTVAHVDLDRYAGRWYEIAKIPNRFQKQCAGGTTAEYALRDDGRIDVVNRCTKADGTLDEARGVARVVDTATGAKLEVSFVRFLWRSWFWGDYWVIGLDDDYRWAIVGHPERTYGWILSRTPALDEGTLQAIFTKLRAQGYAPDDFEMTPQPGPTSE